MKRVIVPEGMVKAAIFAWRLHPIRGYPPEDAVCKAVEAALRWLSENPIVPTMEQATEMSDSGHPCVLDGVWYATEWQRRMFLAPEPEVHEEDKDYVCTSCGVFHRGWTKPGHKTPCPACSGTSIEMRGYFPRRNESEDLEPVKDLLLPHLEGAVCKTDGINATIIEAYRRGKEAK